MVRVLGLWLGLGLGLGLGSGLGLGHSRVLARCASGLDPSLTLTLSLTVNPRKDYHVETYITQML